MVYCYNHYYYCITILLSLGNYANERVVEMNFFTDEKQLIVSTNKRLLLLILGNRSNYATSSTITTTTTSNINSSSVVVTPLNASLKRLSLSPKSSSSPSVLSSTLSPSATVSTPITTAENISSTSSPPSPSPSSSSSSTTTTKPFLMNNIESSKNESEDSTFISSNLKHENLDIIGWVELDRAIPGKKGIFAMYATSKYVPISPGASTAKLQRIITQWRIVEEDNEMSFAYHKSSSSSSSSSGKKKSNCSIYRFEWTDEMFQSALDKIKYF